MSDEFDPTREDPAGIAYVDEQGAPEEGVSQSRNEEPPATVPTETVSEEETPPEPDFLIHRNKYGPGAHGIYLPEGEPVGVWLAREHTALSGEEVESLLTDMGMEPDLAAWFGKNRTAAAVATAELHSMPEVTAFAQEEASREARMDPIRQAFIKSKGSKTGG